MTTRSTNTEQPLDVCALPRNMCYENKLMVASGTDIQESSQAIYLNVHEADNLCIPNDDKRKWYKKYITLRRIFDFFLLIIVMGFAALVEFGYVRHVKLGFYCADPMLSHRFTGDTITTSSLVLVTVFCPMLVIYLVAGNRLHEKRASLSNMWLWYRGYLISLVSFLVLCQTLKVTTGEHRPHFLYTCAPDAAEMCSPGDYITEYRCLNTGGFKGYIVPDSSLSFPSGHAGIATITSLFCAVLIHIRFNARRTGILIKPLLITIVIAWGFVVGISRIQDHRHHWWDVLAGAVLGITFAAYSINFHCYSFILRIQESIRHENICVSTIHQNSNKQQSTTAVDGNSSKDSNTVIR